MITLITQNEKDMIKEHIKMFFKGEIDIIEIDCINPSKLIGLLSECGVTDDFEDFDCNSWDWDYWINFNHNGKKYTMSGNGYYGGVKVYETKE